VRRNLPEHVYPRKRKGRVDLYFWRGHTGDPWIRIREEPNTPEFHERVSVLLKKGSPKVGLKRTPPVVLESGEKPNENTFRWLCLKFYRSVDCHLKREKPLLDACCREPIAPKDKRTFADLPLSRLTLKELKVLRDRKAKQISEVKPRGLLGASRSRVKALRRLCKWAREEGILDFNPAIELEQIKGPKTRGHIPWDDDDCKKFRYHWKVGTVQRAAMEIMASCGTARSDVIRVGSENVRSGKDASANPCKVLDYRRQKTGTEGTIPIPKRVLDIIAATKPVGFKIWLVTPLTGKPFTSAASFGNFFGDAVREAGIYGKNSHGLRKYAATKYAETGKVTAPALCAAFAWCSLSEAQKYIDEANRHKMGSELAGLVE